jgi:hypothetical protein
VIDICIQPFLEIYFGEINLSSIDDIRGDFASFFILFLIMWVFAAFGNNRKHNGKNIKANTLEAMAKACGTKSDNKSTTSQTGDYKGCRLLICHNTIDFTKNNINIFTGII